MLELQIRQKSIQTYIYIYTLIYHMTVCMSMRVMADIVFFTNLIEFSRPDIGRCRYVCEIYDYKIAPLSVWIIDLKTYVESPVYARQLFLVTVKLSENVLRITLRITAHVVELESLCYHYYDISIL